MSWQEQTASGRSKGLLLLLYVRIVQLALSLWVVDYSGGTRIELEKRVIDPAVRWVLWLTQKDTVTGGKRGVLYKGKLCLVAV